MATYILGYLVYKTVGVLSSIASSASGLSVLTSAIRTKKESEDIRKLMDDDLFLEVRIKVLDSFISELKNKKINKESYRLISLLLPKINCCFADINKKLERIGWKLRYNEQIYYFYAVRSYSFIEDEIKLKELGDRLSKLEDMFYNILEKEKEFNNFISDKMNRSEMFKSQISSE